jgi:hypothetical protein
MKPLLVKPTPRQWRRYEPHEMSGPLPSVICKILSATHADRLMRDGEMMWSTLTWFQNLEDFERGDDCEGLRPLNVVRHLRRIWCFRARVDA